MLLDELVVLVVEFEATCADDGSIPPDEMEVIEVGAAWATLSGTVLDTFEHLVRPLKRPRLTPFCLHLTKISQSDVDAAPDWPHVAERLAGFAAQRSGRVWGSWGNYDRHQLQRQSDACRVTNPLSGWSHHNLKAAFARSRKIKQVGMRTALGIVGLSHVGAHHRALPDALGIASLLPHCMRSRSNAPDVAP